MICGITGCVSAGKSSAAAILASFGARVLDVDEVAAQALAQSDLGLTAAQALAAVLTSGSERTRIEAVLIPLVRQRVATWCAESKVPGVLDAALLFEHGLETFCDFTICVCCPIGERRRRVLERSTASSRLFDAIEAAQWPEEQKAKCAGVRVSGIEELTGTMRSFWYALTPTLSPAGERET